MGGVDPHIPNSLPLHRLDHHCAIADDRVLPHPVRSQQQDHPGLILEALDRDCGHACVRLHWRGSLVPGGAWVGFAGGMCGWFFILFEIFGGEAGSVAGELGSANKFTQASFSTMRLIVTAGWSIYPAGYFFGYLMGCVDDCSLNLIYNLADFVNKIAFCLAIWQAAKNESLSA